MISIIVNNSYSQLQDATRQQLVAIQREIVLKSVEYGYGYLSKKDFPRLIKGVKLIYIKDLKGIARIVTNINRRPFTSLDTVKDALFNKKPVIYNGYAPRIVQLVSPRGEFPTGLLRRVVSLLERLNVKYEVRDERVRRRLPSLSNLAPKYPHEPYPEQSEAAAACMDVDRGIVVASTGVGKSLIIAQIIANIQLKTLIVVPSLELKRQLTDALTGVFGPKHVGKNIVVENVQALDTSVPADFDCLILDEFHHSAAETYQTLNKVAWSNIYYRYGLTATPFRNNAEEAILLESIIDRIVYEIPYKKAVDNGYIVPLEAYYVDAPVTENVKGDTWSEVYSELVVNNQLRNEMIIDILVKLKWSNIATLCIVKELKHGEALAKEARVPFANGQDGKASEMIRNFCDQKQPCLIGTQGVLGEGVDTKPAEYVILAGLGKSVPATMQAIGRCFRRYGDKESGKVILIRDVSHKWTKDHFNEQCRILKEQYGVTPERLELT